MATQTTKKKKPNIFKRMGTWFKDSWDTFKKVTWPSPSAVFKNLGIVLVVVVSFLVAIGLADALFGWLLKLLVG